MTTRILRCAIYTRKSSEEGLEQEFNSLDAQREACASYIQSQKHEGWRLSTTRYDDGGFSGGSMNRPALQHLLADVEAGVIDLVVVYKVDRLTRALIDFSKMVERFDARGVSFVSVTQAFNTTTSMGRLTLNVLLSFAQFEREVTGERIRDKIAASKRKGMWMGGIVPLGYQTQGRQLVIAEAEAAQVRHIYERYIELANVDELRRELARDGYRGKGRYRDGQQTSSISSNGALTRILTNPLYRGWICHRGELHAGQHEAIVSQDMWDRTQSIIALRKRGNTSMPRARARNPLLGLLRDEQSRSFYATYTAKRGHLPYRYYVTRKTGEDVSKPLRLPAAELEHHVDTAIIGYLSDKRRLLSDFELQKESALSSVLLAVDELAKAPDAQRWQQWRALIGSVTYATTTLRIAIKKTELSKLLGLPAADDSAICVESPIALHRVGNDIRLVLPAAQGQPEASKIDVSLVRFIARGRQWYKELTSGARSSLTAIAQSENVTVTYVARLIRGSLLAPDIVRRILEGRQPIGLTVQSLSTPIPVDWAEQRREFGA